jgi:hypothetical protein
VKRRLVLTGLAIAVLLLAVGGWTFDAFKSKGD